jgi:hypothetical protein
MSRITLSGNASGTGNFTLASPNSNTDRTLTLPDATGTVVTDSATQTLTNKTIQGGALTLGTAVASTSGTSIDFTGIPSWAKRVTVMFNGVSTNGTANVLIRVGSTSFSTTGYSSSCAIINGGTSQQGSTAGLCVAYAAVSLADTFTGFATLSLFSSNRWVLSGSMQSSALAGSILLFSGGSPELAGALDRVRITTVNGTDTFDAGTINISYEG